MNSRQWVEAMPPDIARSTVPRTQPSMIDEELAETWWRQHVIKEARYAKAKEELSSIDSFGIPVGEKDPLHYHSPHDGQLVRRVGPLPGRDRRRRRIMDTVFPQDFTQCEPVIGFRCDYVDICHDRCDPLSSGIYRVRPTYAERVAEESANEIDHEVIKS